MTLTLTFAWWWIAAIAAIIGLLLIVTSKDERDSFMGWTYTTLGRGGWIGLLLCAFATVYLLCGALARALP